MRVYVILLNCLEQFHTFSVYYSVTLGWIITVSSCNSDLCIIIKTKNLPLLSPCFMIWLHAGCFICVQLCVTPWTVAHQAPLFMGFSRQQYWSKEPCPPPGDLPDPGIKPRYLMSPALADRFFTTSPTWEGEPKLTAFFCLPVWSKCEN